MAMTIVMVLVLAGGAVALADDVVVVASELTAEEVYAASSAAVVVSVRAVGNAFAALAEAKTAGEDDLVIAAAADAAAVAVAEMVALCAEKSALATDMAYAALGVAADSGITLDDIMANGDRAFAAGEALEEIDPASAIEAYDLAANLYERCAVAYGYFEDAEEMNTIVVELGDPAVDWAASFLLRDVESLNVSAAGLLEAADEMMADLEAEIAA